MNLRLEIDSDSLSNGKVQFFLDIELMFSEATQQEIDGKKPIQQMKTEEDLAKF